MPYRIADGCIGCASCESECPNEAISQGFATYVVDPRKCTECVGWFAKAKCAEVCPVDVCLPDPAHQEDREQLLAKWRGLHPGETPRT